MIAIPARSVSGICLLLLMLSVAALPPASAVAIGVNRAAIEFKDVIRDGYAEASFVVSTDSKEPIGGGIEVEGDIASWLSFSPENITTEGFAFSADAPFTITVIVQPPTDAAVGNYSGSLRVITGEIGRTSTGKIGTSTRAAIKIGTLVGITGLERKSCVLGGFLMRAAEIGTPLEFIYSVANSGNVRVRPKATITVFGRDEQQLFTVPVASPNDVLPTTSKNFLSTFDHELDFGQYWASFSSNECAGGGYVSFDVLERGGVADQGEFLALESLPWNNVGDIIPVTAVFRNTGPRSVNAKFQGVVMRGKKLMKQIESDTYATPPGENARIEMFYNPTEPGQYEVKGRVHYNNKITSERSVILNVNGTAIDDGGSAAPLLLLLLVIIVLLLLFIRRRRRRR